jgi:hypothetical protein
MSRAQMQTSCGPGFAIVILFGVVLGLRARWAIKGCKDSALEQWHALGFRTSDGLLSVSLLAGGASARPSWALCWTFSYIPKWMPSSWRRF